MSHKRQRAARLTRGRVAPAMKRAARGGFDAGRAVVREEPDDARGVACGEVIVWRARCGEWTIYAERAKLVLARCSRRLTEVNELDMSGCQ